MNLFFLGGIFSDKERDAIVRKSRRGFQAAADTLQKNYINGFSQSEMVERITVINLPFIGAYPKRYQDIFYSPLAKEDSLGRAKILNIGFLNFLLVKNFHKIYLAVRHILAQTSACPSEKNYLVCYSMHLPFLLACHIVKIKRKNIHLCIIVPDLPEYMSVRTGLVGRLFNLLFRISYYVVNRADSIVAITADMLDKFEPSIAKVVIEGIADPQYVALTGGGRRKKYFLYTGTLDVRYGIRNLLDSFLAAGIDDYELHICGDGDDRAYVESVAARVEGVKYFGQLDRIAVLKLQRDASLLINPRGNDSEYTRYSFPSKIIEYMSSGVPVLMYRLDGVPEEYYDFCFLIPSGEGGLVGQLQLISRLPEDELIAKGEAAKKFIVERKMPAQQVHKLLNAIKGCEHV